MIITRKGNIPTVEDWKPYELYRVLDDTYFFTEITKDSFLYRHDYKTVKAAYQEQNICLSNLIGKQAHTEQAREIYNNVVRGLPIDGEAYIHFIARLMCKLFYLGNTLETVIETVDIQIAVTNPFGELSTQDIYDIYEYSTTLQKYNPRPKVVIFNPFRHLNHCHKSIIHVKELSKFNEKKVSQNANFQTISEIATELKCSEMTVKRHIKKQEITTVGNKKNKTILDIQSLRIEQPKIRQKQVSEILEISLRTVERYWNLTN